jgi:FKBP-type peptidyl-prolyl cis-trans isomerase FklB
MKHALILQCLAFVCIGAAASGAMAQAAPATSSASASAPATASSSSAAPVPGGFASRQAAISYAIGLDMVRNFRSQDVAVDIDQLVQGIRDAATTGKPISLSDEEARILVAELEAQVRGKMAASRRQAAEFNARKTEDFLKQQAAVPGTTTTPSGLVYRVLRAGHGPTPGDSAMVSVNYVGSLPDGKSFDSSPQGKPAQLKLSTLIPGWREALKLMPTGSKWYVVVPPKLAYGERGAGNVIGPNQALVFDIELVGVQ